MDTVTLSKADLEALVQKLVDQRVNERLNDMQSSLEHLKGQVTHGGGNVPEDRATLVVFSGEMDTLFAACTIAGPIFFKHLMKQRNVESLPDMVALVQELGVRMVACETSMGVMGLTRDELLEGIDYGGVATYLGDAARSKITLFV